MNQFIKPLFQVVENFTYRLKHTDASGTVYGYTEKNIHKYITAASEWVEQEMSNNQFVALAGKSFCE